MAFNDAFLVIGISLAVGAAAVWFCKETPGGGGAAAH